MTSETSFDVRLFALLPPQSNTNTIAVHEANSSMSSQSMASPWPGAQSDEQPVEGVGGWIALPLSVCSYYRKGTCLRAPCYYFHGTEQKLKEVRNAGGVLYRFNDGRVYYSSQPTTTARSSNPTSPAIKSKSPSTEMQVSRIGTKKSVVACLSFICGTCTRSDCRFVHLKDDIRHVPRSVCAYHISPHGCTKGSSCRYYHGTQDSLEELKSLGVSLYNPFNNEPYLEVPDVLEDPRFRQQSDVVKPCWVSSPSDLLPVYLQPSHTPSQYLTSPTVVSPSVSGQQYVYCTTCVGEPMHKMYLPQSVEGRPFPPQEPLVVHVPPPSSYNHQQQQQEPFQGHTYYVWTPPP